jgi:hypothetical protein
MIEDAIEAIASCHIASDHHCFQIFFQITAQNCFPHIKYQYVEQHFNTICHRELQENDSLH